MRRVELDAARVRCSTREERSGPPYGVTGRRAGRSLTTNGPGEPDHPNNIQPGGLDKGRLHR
jgi:hypothetical protein